MQLKRKGWRRVLTCVTALTLTMAVLTACGENQENAGNTSSSQETSGEQASGTDHAGQTSTNGETASDEMTVEKIRNMEDPTAQYDAAKAMYDEIKDNPTGNIQQATELLMIMANNKLGKGNAPDTALLAKLDELLETYHGQYFIIPMDENGVANRNAQNIAGSNAYRKNLPITLYDESGKEIIDYSVDKEIVMKYHCIGAFSISDSLCITEEFAYPSTANGGAGANFISFAINRKSNNNEKDYEFEYDDLGRLIRMKWKVYPVKSDKQGNIVVLDNQYKTVQYDFSYREDGYLHSAACSGYSYNYWYDGDFIDGEYVEYDGEPLVFEDTEDHKLELLSLEDGTCIVKGVTKAKYKKLSSEEELISLYAGGSIYYDLKKDRVAKVYCCEQLGDGLEMWRKFKFYFKSKGDLKDIIEAKTAYIIYRGKNASTNVWTDDQKKDFLFDYLFNPSEQ